MSTHQARFGPRVLQPPADKDTRPVRIKKKKITPVIMKTGRLLGELRTHRRIGGLTLRHVAHKLGTTAQSVSRLERGLQPMTISGLFEYCEAIGVHVDVFVSERAGIGG